MRAELANVSRIGRCIIRSTNICKNPKSYEKLRKATYSNKYNILDNFIEITVLYIAPKTQKISIVKIKEKIKS